MSVVWEGGTPPDVYVCTVCGSPLCTLVARKIDIVTGAEVRSVAVQRACRGCGLVYAVPEGVRDLG